ncbi:MAG: ribosomal protein S18-alanine N-acetyltransferase, partial [Acidimicrobiales bacterium]
MHRRDLKAVLGIEKQVFPEPWSSAIFGSELALRHGRSYRVARLGRRIVGYRGVMLSGEEAHVTT